MENNRSATNNSEEIDLGDLFRFIKKGFANFGLLILRFFNFLIRNALLLLILIVVGVVAGYFLDAAHPKKYETQLLVNSSFESGEYLYKSVQETEFKFENADTAFYKKIGVSPQQAKELEIKIEPVLNVMDLSPEQQSYLNFIKENNLLNEEQKKEMFDKNYTFQKITLIHPLRVNSQSVLKNILATYRNNDYYKEVNQDYLKDVKQRYQSNEKLIHQIDTLVKNYSHSFSKNNTAGLDATYYNADNSMDLGEVLNTRIKLQQENNNLLQNKADNTEFLRIVDLGSPRNAEGENWSSEKIFLLPLWLILAFFLFVLVGKVYKRAKMITEPTNQ